jgi:hypothetical protein
VLHQLAGLDSHDAILLNSRRIRSPCSNP